MRASSARRSSSRRSTTATARSRASSSRPTTPGSDFSAYANTSFQAAHGKDVESSQFNFTQQQLDYIADNYIHLDHEGRVSASGGVSYLWSGTRLSVDMLFGTGLREDLHPALTDSIIPNGDAHAQLRAGQSRA